MANTRCASHVAKSRSMAKLACWRTGRVGRNRQEADGFENRKRLNLGQESGVAGGGGRENPVGVRLIPV